MPPCLKYIGILGKRYINYVVFSLKSHKKWEDIKMDLLKHTIVFEGLDGAGTTTQRNKLIKYLEEKGKKVFLTNEPTGNMIGRLIRDILQKKYRTTDKALALLYAADRDDHLYNPEYGIKKHIEDGEYVICDRYFYSSFAYQGVTLDWSFIAKLNTFPHPEVLIYIDTPTQECINRIEKRGEEKELFEKAEFLQKVEQGYNKIFSTLPDDVRFIKIDGTLSQDAIFEKILVYLVAINFFG